MDSSQTTQSRRPSPRVYSLLLLLVASLLGVSCSNQTTVPATSTHTSFLNTSDGKRLPLRHWNLQSDPQTILIGLHGIEGAARDFGNLGKSLSQQSPTTTLYALNLRGSGYDPSPQDRGNIKSPALWQRDLLELHQQLKKRHPKARTIWIGESMGALITLHTVANSSTPPDGLVLVSPVVSLDTIPAWQIISLRLAAFLAPGARISLEALAGGSFQATTKSNHFDQSQTNPYHVERYTLRYLATLAKLSQTMTQQATKAELPVLVLHGGKDFLSNDLQIQEFTNAFARSPKRHKFPSSHHLLFYDKQKKEVISSILNWEGLYSQLR